ncbi:MAG: EamA family transporter [Euryarchaeota archaeon]|nr:EamA family transporter [Euryarchaeota archaeon]
MVWWIYALITMLMFGTTNFLVKYAGHSGMDSVFTSIVLWLATGATGFVFLLIYHREFAENLKNTNPWLLLLPISAGVALAMGMYAIKIALTKGPAGPTVAITAANAFIVAFLAYVLLGEDLSPLKIIGMLVIFAGIILLTL